MRGQLISILTIPLLTSCFTDKNSFCKKYESEKNQVIEIAIDSLNNIGGQIAKNYFLLGQLENDVKTFEKVLNSNFKHDYTQSNDGTCNAMLRALETIESEKYLKMTDNGRIKSYIPILTFDRLGKIKSIAAEIKYDKGKIDTVSDATTGDFETLVDQEKLKKFKKERDEKVIAQRTQNERKREEQETIEKQNEAQKVKQEKAEKKKALQDLIANSISAQRLCRQYRENEIRADKVYLNQEITVKGIVSSVDKQSGDISINLEGDDFIATVSCVTTDEDGASRLRKGQLVVIKGTCVGIDEITKILVTIKNSKIVAY